MKKDNNEMRKPVKTKKDAMRIKFSERANKAWVTRRAKARAEMLSKRAKKAWRTRRKMQKQVVS